MGEDFDLYVYISTDSVYDASEVTLQCEIEEAYKDYQETGIPESLGYLKTKLGKEERRKLRKQDSYGFKKLQAEELLVKSIPSEKLLSLRLADVIGPYDETFRFWKQVIWTQH